MPCRSFFSVPDTCTCAPALTCACTAPGEQGKHGYYHINLFIFRTTPPLNECAANLKPPHPDVCPPPPPPPVRIGMGSEKCSLVFFPGSLSTHSLSFFSCCSGPFEWAAWFHTMAAMTGMASASRAVLVGAKPFGRGAPLRACSRVQRQSSSLVVKASRRCEGRGRPGSRLRRRGACAASGATRVLCGGQQGWQPAAAGEWGRIQQQHALSSSEWRSQQQQQPAASFVEAERSLGQPLLTGFQGRSVRLRPPCSFVRRCQRLTDPFLPCILNRTGRQRAGGLGLRQRAGWPCAAGERPGRHPR